MKKLDYRIEELAFNGKYAQCCSFGGLISTVNPKLAQKIIEHRINASPYDYVTYCTNCRDDFARNGKPAWHMLDLIFEQPFNKRALRRPPSYSERRANRIHLKEELLNDLWGEKVEVPRNEYEKINLLLSEELAAKLVKDYILMDEVRQVIHYAGSTGYKLIDNDSKHFIAHLQLGIITYWVEYLPVSSGYKIYNAYSHRMQIMEEKNCNERA
ncbi:hypothetical protein Psch_04164 [Pelotomaculum schinkii]|uniref:Cysteine-rich domain-containing protein n=1 Tax=Pelotomaculum schinkii TaxID=78350 RepID=A0A4Y7R6G3_9FIRM|nr:hypothetical protein [Pelotomaculum schinkii]TEB04437.1 hypothetical protein Psch_04164 [Pelotomaculum schinkii]